MRRSAAMLSSRRGRRARAEVRRLPAQIVRHIARAGEREHPLAERLLRIGDLDLAGSGQRAVVEHRDRLVGAAHDHARRARRGLVAFRILGRLDGGVDGVELARRIVAKHHAGMGDRHRLGRVVGDDHRHADSGDAEQQGGEFLRQADAAVRGGIARQLPGVQRDPRPGQPVHVGHGRIVVGRRVMVLVLLQDLEHPRRRAVPGLAGRAGRGPDAHAVAVHMDKLLGQRDDDQDRPAGRAVGIPVEFAVLELIGRLVDQLRPDGSKRQAQRGCAPGHAGELAAVHVSGRLGPRAIEPLQGRDSGGHVNGTRAPRLRSLVLQDAT